MRTVWAPLVALLLGLVASSCLGDRTPPEKLMDGSAVEPLPVELEDVDEPAVLTAVRVVQRSSQDRHIASCLRGRAPDARPLGPIVHRVGVGGESVSFREASGLRACDESTGEREDGRPWCDGAFGRLRGGRLLDPRLSIGCRTDDDEPVAFGWVEPAFGTRYVAVSQRGFAEVYETAGGIPVRVATLVDVDATRARASFSITEHGQSGQLLRRYRLEAAVAG